MAISSYGSGTIAAAPIQATLSTNYIDFASGSGVDWSIHTKKQLDKWGCKYTRIETLKKPSFDLFIDDKSKRIEEI